MVMTDWISALAPLDPCPIIQAPMAGAGGVDLAIAAIRGGAIGSLPCAMIDVSEIAAQVSAVRAAASGPINLNFFCHTMPKRPDETAWRALLAPYYAEYGLAMEDKEGALRRPFDVTTARAVMAAQPDIVSFHFGLPRPHLMDQVRQSGARIIATATSISEAHFLAEAGVDAVIAQGWEAGGHRGNFLDEPAGSEMGLFALLPQIVDAVNVPVIAAGGISDGRGIAAALMLGASAVQIGSAYLRSTEATISAPYGELLGSQAVHFTCFTNVMSGRNARGIRNRVIQEIGPQSDTAPIFPYAASALTPLRKAAEAQGKGDFSPLWSGQAVGLSPAGDAEYITHALAADAAARLKEAKL